MRISGLAARALSSAAVVMLAGCDVLRQAQDDTPPPGAMPLSRAIATHVGRGSQPVAARDARGGPCLYLLSTSEASDLSHVRIVGRRCYIYINDTANMSYSKITTAKILYSGSAPNETGATFPEATPAPGPTVNDPCPTIPGCSYLMDHPPSIFQCSPAQHYNNFTLSPGCYNGLILSGTGTLNPGLYVINGQFHVNGANVSGSGVTIYMTANVQDTNFSDARVTLSAPASGNYSGVLFYRPLWQSASVNFSNCTCDFTGILYFPTTSVNYDNIGDNYQLLIFGQTNLSNGQRLRFGPP